MKKLPQALFFDFDGTIVDPKSHEVPQSALDALKQLHEKGYHICIASGRGYPLLKMTGIMEQFPWSGYVLNNGQLIKDENEETLIHHFIDHEAILQIIEEANKLDLNIQFGADEGDFMNKEANEYVRNSHEFFHEPIAPIGVYTNQKCDKILVYNEFGYDYAPFKAIKGLAVFPGRSDYADIACEGVSKASAIIEMCKHKGWDVHYAAFGDSHNDMEMLLGASLKVAMGNGEEDLKAIADVVAPNVWDDGLAKVLKELGYID